MEKQEVIRLIQAHDWLWDKWWPALLRLPEAQAHQDVGGSFRCVFDTAAHMVGAEIVWQDRLEGNSSAVFPPPPVNMQDLHSDWLKVAERRQQWLEDASTAEIVPYQFTGGSASNRVDEIILHLTSHAHFHRGQLASQFRLLALTPPSSHLIGFFRL